VRLGFTLASALTVQAVAFAGPQQTQPQHVFQPSRDGFNFENYGNDDNPVNLTPAMVERLCGLGSCERGSGDTCVLSAAMRGFMDEQNQAMDSGHCEGMSGLAQAMHTGHVPLDKFAPNARKAYDLSFSNRSLQSEIAFFFAMQATDPAAFSEMRLSPSQVIAELNKDQESYIVGLYNPDGTDGHAVTASRVLKDSPVASRIEIYDSNHPGEPQYINVNTAANTWSYADYTPGNAQTETLTLLPLSKRFGQNRCLAFGNDDAESRQGEFGSSWEVILDGPGRLEAPRSARAIWRRAGFKEGSLEPSYVIRRDQGDVDLLIHGEHLKGKGKTSVFVMKHGQVFSLEGITLHPGEIDKIQVGSDGESFKYSTKDKEDVSLRLDETYKGADYEIRVHPTPVETGFAIKIQNVPDSKEGHHKLLLSLKARDGKAAGYTLDLTRISGASDEQFTHHHELAMMPNEIDTLEYGKWLKNKQPLSILKDVDGDGTIDKKEQVNDEE
jgi:hypothetical protein